jgi:hypothetical protein
VGSPIQFYTRLFVHFSLAMHITFTVNLVLLDLTAVKNSMINVKLSLFLIN